MPLFNKAEIEAATRLVQSHIPATPQYEWPQLSKRTGATVWVKHENHTPAGAFKIRGGITFIDWLKRIHPDVRGVVTATRGNHGQSQARAATAAGLTARIVVPRGNSVEKNAAMRAFGGEVVEHGNDFDAALQEAMRLAEEENLFPVPPFHEELLRGVATYAYEFFTSAPPLDTVYVPIGCGSGICGLITVRDCLGLSTKIVGVVSTEAQAVKLSVERGELVSTDSANTIADGVAVRVPVKQAYDIYATGAERIIAVTDDEVAAAMRAYFKDTHNVAEGAGAAPLAGLMQEQASMQGKTVGLILCGGNVDSDVFAAVLRGETPRVA
jgi:threonine dehydratase